MEKQKAILKGVLPGHDVVYLEIEGIEIWYMALDRAIYYVNRIRKNSEVLVSVDEDNNLFFIQEIKRSNARK
jgi:hypothetical protein